MNTEISNQFVSYEIAVRLKELGFDEPCFATYNKLTNGKIDLLPKKFGVNEMASLVSAPTYDQVFNWLEEKHQIFIEIGVDCTTYPKFCYSVNKFFGNPKDLTEKEWGWEHPKPKNWYLYKSRKEAVEEVIKFSLTLI